MILFLGLVLGLSAGAVTIEERVTTVDDKTITEIIEVPTKKLTHHRIVQTVRKVIEEGIPARWQDGRRVLKAHDLTAPDDLDITRMRFIDGVVSEIEVYNNIVYTESHGRDVKDVKARCEVFLEKEQRIFQSNYFLCVNEHGEEIEYER